MSTTIIEKSEKTAFQQKCAQRLTELIKRQDPDEQKAPFIFYNRLLEIHLTFSINSTHYNVLPKHSYQFVSFIWDFLYFGQPYKIIEHQVVFKTVNELTDEIIDQLHRGQNIEKYNCDLTCNAELGMTAAAKVLAEEYGTNDLIERLAFLEALRNCFSY